MPGPFTGYVASLGARGEPPAHDDFELLWSELKGLVRREIHRRGLGEAPPRFLGIHGWESWSDEALEELTADAYTFNFVDRLRSLRAQLRTKSSIDGLVVRNVRNLLFERQREHDPIGFRVFELLRRAVRHLLALGRVAVLRGPTQVRNDTLLALADGDAPIATPGQSPPPSPAADLEEIGEGWGDRLFRELLLAHGAQQDGAVLRLARQLLKLPGLGISAFLFRDLADPLKRAVRRRWTQLYLEDQGDDVLPDLDAEAPSRQRVRQLVQVRHPDRGPEVRRDFRKLTDCVARLLDEQDLRSRTREYLADLWRFLRIYAIEEENLPSQRRLSELLSIPRDRFPGLFDILGDLLTRCRSHLAGRLARTSPAVSKVQVSEPKARRDTLHEEGPP